MSNKKNTNVPFIEMGRRIKSARKRLPGKDGKPMKGPEFSEKLGISRSSLSNYERGAREPGSEVTKKIARLCNTTTDHLLGNTADALLSEDSEEYQISEGRSDKDSGQRYNTGSPKDNIIGEAELEAMKDKYIEVLEENRELQKKVDSLKAELELFKSGKPKTQGRGNG